MTFQIIKINPIRNHHFFSIFARNFLSKNLEHGFVSSFSIIYILTNLYMYYLYTENANKLIMGIRFLYYLTFLLNIDIHNNKSLCDHRMKIENTSSKSHFGLVNVS